MINWLKTLRKKKTESGTDNQVIPTRKQYHSWHYKLYVRSDETNRQLVEGLADINWAEFLNKDIPPGATEDDLAHELIVGDYYVVGKRLVKYCYTLPNSHVIVSDFARLTPEPEEEHYEKWRRRHAPHVVDLDSDGYKKEQQEKANEVKEKQKDIKEIKTPLYV